MPDVQDDPELLPGAVTEFGINGSQSGFQPREADGLLKGSGDSTRPLTQGQKPLRGGMHHSRRSDSGRALGTLQRGATKASLLEQSDIAKARAMFYKYDSNDHDEQMSYEQFTTMMRSEFDADNSTIDDLWSLDGFTTRTADVSRRVVVTSDSFVVTAARLGLFGRKTSPPIAYSTAHNEQRCCGVKVCCRFDDMPLVNDKQVHRVPSKGLIDPENYIVLKSGSVGGCLSYWDAWLLLLLMVVTAAIPLRIGFDLPLTTAWLICDIITDVSFISDIVLNFVMCYEDEATMKFVVDASEIRRRYMGTWTYRWGPFGFLSFGWFYYDVLSCLPVTYFQLLMGGMENASDAKLARLLRLVRLAKVLKLAKIANLLQRNADSLRDIDGLDVIKAGVMTAIFSHLTACGWHWVAIIEHDRISDPRELPLYALTDQMHESGEPYTWIEGYDDTLLNATTSSKYGAALYFATTTLSTVGYGDILPINENERMYTAFFQVIGVFTFGYTMGTLSGYIIDGKLDPKTQKYNEMMPKIEAYLKRKNVSHIETSGTDIKKHFGNVLLHSDAVMDEELVVSYMRIIDPVMCRKVLTEIYQPQQLGSTKAAVVGSYFRVFEEGAQTTIDGRLTELPTANGEILLDLNNQMEPAHDDNGKTSFADGAEIVREGDIIRGIYVVTAGRCVKSTWECYVRAKTNHRVGNGRVTQPGILSFGKGDLIAVTERNPNGKWKGYVAWDKATGQYTPSTVSGEFQDWTKERAELAAGEFDTLDANGVWNELVEADPWKRHPFQVGCLEIPAADDKDKFNWTEGELGVGDCFGLHAALGGTQTGDGKSDRHIKFSVRAKQVMGVEPLKLTFLPLERLEKLFKKHPMLEKTLRVQVALLDSLSGQPNALQRRRMMEQAGFPLSKQDAAAAYESVLAEQKRSAGPETRAQVGLTPDSVLGYLAKFHDVLPLNSELHHEERVEMIKSAFDKDKGGDIDVNEFWNGLQVFMDPVKSAKKLRVPTRTEQPRTLQANVHDLNSKVDSMRVEISELKTLITQLHSSERHRPN
eukprot:COSAG02_NODE_4448_length_5345_cov_5.091689_1_plen_1042_part_00